jgi:hypothetical protein
MCVGQGAACGVGSLTAGGKPPSLPAVAASRPHPTTGRGRRRPRPPPPCPWAAPRPLRLPPAATAGAPPPPLRGWIRGLGRALGRTSDADADADAHSTGAGAGLVGGDACSHVRMHGEARPTASWDAVGHDTTRPCKRQAGRRAAPDLEPVQAQVLVRVCEGREQHRPHAVRPAHHLTVAPACTHSAAN